MKTQNQHTTKQTSIQTKFDWLLAWLPADFWLTVCDAHSSYRQVRFTCASHGCTKTHSGCVDFAQSGLGFKRIQLSYVPSLFQSLKSNIQNLNMLPNIILFNHSFGGLSPPKAARVQV